MKKSAYKIILASSSPRRRELIEFLGTPVDFVVPEYTEEPPYESENPASYAVRMSESKVLVSSEDQESGTIIIGSDTVVSIDNVILGKPRNDGHAEYMLRLLRNKEHDIHTALSVLWKNKHQLTSTKVITGVRMRDYSDMDIARYIASGDPMDKAGGYAIQNKEFPLVENLEGCYTSAIGLPLCNLTETLTKIGVQLPDIRRKYYMSLFNDCTDCFFLNPASDYKRGGSI